jgi:hypothetical protein
VEGMVNQKLPELKTLYLCLSFLSSINIYTEFCANAVRVETELVGLFSPPMPREDECVSSLLIINN